MHSWSHTRPLSLVDELSLFLGLGMRGRERIWMEGNCQMNVWMSSRPYCLQKRDFSGCVGRLLPHFYMWKVIRKITSIEGMLYCGCTVYPGKLAILWNQVSKSNVKFRRSIFCISYVDGLTEFEIRRDFGGLKQAITTAQYQQKSVVLVWFDLIVQKEVEMPEWDQVPWKYIYVESLQIDR